jgi:hypothetical protein
MGAQPETKLVGRIRDAITDEYPDAWITKISGGPYQTAGIPDLLVCIKGILFGLEVKAQRVGESREHALGRTTDRQQAQIDGINRAGGIATTVLSPGEALALIEDGLKMVAARPPVV